MKLVHVLPALFCLTAPALAQTSPGSDSTAAISPSGKPALPDGPLLRPAPEFSHWEITYAYGEEKKKDSDTAPKQDAARDVRPRKTVITKTGRIIHQEETDMLNRTTDSWFSGATKYMKSGSDPTWYQMDPGSVAHTAEEARYNPLPPNGFRDMEVVGEKNYAGTISYGSGDCLVFVPGGYQQLNLKDASRQKKIDAMAEIAYIDAETRLPVVVRKGSVLRTFRFGAPPTAMQTLPGDLSAQIRKGAEGRARLEQAAPRPY